MNNNEQHRVGVNVNTLMIRHLKLEGPLSDNHQLIEEEIDQLMGVDAVSINLSEGLLNVAYDATKRQLGEIEEIIKKHKCDISHDWWTHSKESHYKFVDQNVKENSQRAPWSCHIEPPSR